MTVAVTQVTQGCARVTRNGRVQLLLCRRSRGSYGGVADGVAVDDELDAAVALAAFGGVVGSDRLRFAEASRGDGRSRNAVFGKKIADGIGAALRELLIKFIGADTVGVAFDLKRQAGVREDYTGNLGELLAGAGLSCAGISSCVPSSRYFAA
jgi:hypothetical protein